MVAHDVSHELRGEHGKWTKGGAALHRLAKEATAGASHAESGHKAGDRVKYKTGAMGVVHHIDDKGVPHVVWDKGRGKPVRTPAHHLTHATSPAAAEKSARDVTGSKTDLKTMSPAELKRARDAITYKPGHLNDADHSRLAAIKAEEAKRFRKEKLAEIGHVPPYKPPRQAGSRGGVPAPTAGGIDPKLLAQVREIQAKEKARMEAENKGRGGVTEYKDVLTTPESAAYLAKLPGGGVQARPFHEVHAEYQAKSQTLQRAIQNPGRYGPGVVPANKRQLEQLDAELRKMGARKTGGGTWEMPPKAGTAEHAAEQLKRDLSSITEQLHDQHHEAGAPLYTPESLTDTRRSDMAAQVRAGQKTIVVKVPSGSEIQMSVATAKYLLSKKR